MSDLPSFIAEKILQGSELWNVDIQGDGVIDGFLIRATCVISPIEIDMDGVSEEMEYLDSDDGLQEDEFDLLFGNWKEPFSFFIDNEKQEWCGIFFDNPTIGIGEPLYFFFKKQGGLIKNSYLVRLGEKMAPINIAVRSIEGGLLPKYRIISHFSSSFE